MNIVGMLLGIKECAVMKGMIIMENKGWLGDVLECVNSIPADIFSLSDIYEYVDELHEKHPNNQNVEAKIRQQLQVLRDRGVIVFLGNGNYKKVESYLNR